MEHFCQNIQGWFDFQNVYCEAIENAKDGALFIEVGSWMGKSTAFMGVEIVNSRKKINLVCIDAWSSEVDKDIAKYRLDTELAFNEFKKNISIFPFVTYYKMLSDEASKLFLNESADFVFIDASHHYNDVKNDISCWFPKVKTGCVLAGHDANEPSVALALKDSNINYGVTINTWVHHKT